ncbi:MAG: FtsQ-type POTRA domain-containing protein [Erythrobacter sp.]|nr:FtsQ-type POTRA domain-containing protein [Erythrobacter sp.]
MAKIRRGSGKGVRRAAQSQGRQASARRARATTASALDRVMGALPFSEEQWSSIWLTLIIGGALALMLAIANVAGVPAMAHGQIAAIAKDAGFAVRRVQVTGTDRLDEREIYARALAERDRPWPLVDIAALRAELVALTWVEDARVSIQLPATLVVDIVERKPHMALKSDEGLVLVDASGVSLEPVSETQAAGMLRISGPGAAARVPALDRLLKAAPAMGPQVDAAEWVGNRRWNLTFASDQVLALPEGEDAAAKALIDFARLDGQNRLIGGAVAAFDMRAPPRLYMRVPGRAERLELAREMEAEQQVAEAQTVEGQGAQPAGMDE